VEKIAERQRCSVRHVNLTISMAFIALGLVNAAVRCGIGVASWRDAPAKPGHSVVPNGTADSALSAPTYWIGSIKVGSFSLPPGAKKCFYALLRRPLGQGLTPE
jgi:hypothetical protein